MYLGLARPIVVALLATWRVLRAATPSQVADTLAAFAVGLLPFSLYLFALRAFTSRLDTRTPFLINCVENAVNIALGVPALRVARASRARARVLARLLRRRGRHARACSTATSHGIDGPPARRPPARGRWSRRAAVAGVTWAIAHGDRLVGAPARRSWPPWLGGGRRRRASTSGSARLLRVDELRRPRRRSLPRPVPAAATRV